MDDGHATSEEPRPKPLSKRLGTWLGVTASAAGVLAGVLLVMDRWGPKDISLTEWRTRANTVCDKSLNLSPALNAYASFWELANESDSLPSDQFESRKESVANSFTQLADRARSVKADLSSIERPKGHEAEVDQLIESINHGSEMTFKLADDLRDTANPSEVMAIYGDRVEVLSSTGDEQRDLFEKLGAKQCYVDSSAN
ncbi:hypothetical protein [Streptomyces sp. NPDC006335]|uniref:hypothetical protein n=1 Tax=Streptomyces sp. NPDC006335 TaxID=3156895 RepID=UPI0033B8E74D